MLALGILFAIMIALAVVLIVAIMRRRTSGAETAEGLRLEQDRRVQAHNDRMSYNAMLLHGTPPTLSDSYRP
ncbi:hypothetical protein [Streptomyces sp. NPDC086023]|uniref:hypothetical protein n=1 Tax=Streptomyces sp. NPDC086023 TaxID=3365746 RepID=UPI0037D12C8E